MYYISWNSFRLLNSALFFCYIFELISKFNLNYLFCNAKLHLNDSLIILYVFSSIIYTVWMLYVLINFIQVKLFNRNTIWNMLLLLMTHFYFLNNVSYSMYIGILFKTPAINVTLQNGLLNIHPFIIYYTYALAILLWYNIYKKKTFCVEAAFTTTFVYGVLGVIIIGISLGAIWASQELNWGGFWSWDPVEIVSLILLFFFIKIIHSSSQSVLNRSIASIIITIICIYFILRLGVVTSIHSFIRSNNRPAYTVGIIYCILSLYIVHTYKYYITNKKIYFLTNNSKHITNILLISVYTYIIYIICDNVTRSPSTSWSLSHTYIYIICGLLISMIKYLRLHLIYGFYLILYLYLYIFLRTYIFIVGGLHILLAVDKIKYKQFHIVILFLYITFYIFFLNLPFFRLNTNLQNLFYVNINSLSSSMTIYPFFETSFALNKYIYLFKFKNVLYHTTGFAIVSNNLIGIYFFSTNFKLNILFSIETIFLFVCWGLLLLILYIKHEHYNVHNRQVY
jgi:cytochrome c biogenesis factor